MEQSKFLISSNQIKRCPSCRSVYLEDSYCEACGLQLNFKKVGSPMGNKSFYSIVDQHWSEHREIWEPFYPQYRKTLNKKLTNRFRELIDYFQEGGDSDHRKFLVEWDDLLSYLLDREIDGHYLLSLTPLKSAMYQRLGNRIAWKMQEQTFGERLLCWRIKETFQLSHIVIFFGLLSILVMGALAYFRYYFAIL